MPGDVPHAGVHTLHYIRSESAFSHARTRGAWEFLRGKLLRRDPYLLSLGQVAGDRRWAVYRGLQDVPLPAIVGSAGRAREFSRHFHPLTGSERQKERWRHSYTLAMTGTPLPPIDLCQVGPAYFVINGHHRVSVARYLNWRSIQAHVFELPASAKLTAHPPAWQQP
jgi:hypothetical protein